METFLSASVSLKAFIIANAIVMVLTILNRFFVVATDELALSVLGFILIPEKNLALTNFWILVAGFTTFFSILHLGVISYMYKPVKGVIYYIVVSSLILVSKFVAITGALFAKPELSTATPTSSGTYMITPAAPQQSSSYTSSSSSSSTGYSNSI